MREGSQAGPCFWEKQWVDERTRSGQAQSFQAFPGEPPYPLHCLPAALPSDGSAQPSHLHRRVPYPNPAGGSVPPSPTTGVAPGLLLTRLPHTGFVQWPKQSLQACLLSCVSCCLFPLDLRGEGQHQDTQAAARGTEQTDAGKVLLSSWLTACLTSSSPFLPLGLDLQPPTFNLTSSF